MYVTNLPNFIVFRIITKKVDHELTFLPVGQSSGWIKPYSAPVQRTQLILCSQACGELANVTIKIPLSHSNPTIKMYHVTLFVSSSLKLPNNSNNVNMWYDNMSHRVSTFSKGNIVLICSTSGEHAHPHPKKL